MRVALDTNILAYAEGVNGADRKQAALNILQKIDPAEVVIPIQALGELFHVLVRKAGRTAARARVAVLTWQDASQLAETSGTVLGAAMNLATSHHLTIWDSVIISAAAEAGCPVLLSEDLQGGFTWAGTTVCNPFSSPLHPLLRSLFQKRT